MRKLLLLLFAACSLAAAQINVSQVQALAQQATSAYTVLQTATGADGTTCTLYKTAGSTINGGLQCSLNGQTASPVVIVDTSTTSGFLWFAQGGVMWIIGENPTAAAVSFGSVGSAPAKGIAWAVAAAGVTQTGTVSWP